MSGEKLICEIKNLHHDECFANLCKILDGKQTGDSIQFDNQLLKGEIIRNIADKGLTITKWKCTPSQTIHIRRRAAHEGEEKRFVLLYVLTPTNFYLRNTKKIRITGSRNNIFLSNESTLEFILVPKHEFYLFEVSLAPSWLIEELKDADESIKGIIDEHIATNRQTFMVEPFTLEEYKVLHELEVCMLIGKVQDFFIRSRVYNLVINYFTKIVKRSETPVIQTAVQYDQLIEAEMLIMENIKRPPSIASIASKVNMSIASLVRKFKMIHGKSIHEYYLSKKMELARKIIIELGIPIKQMSAIMGYNQPSAFIESFTKQYGYTPGQLRQVSKSFSFF